MPTSQPVASTFDIELLRNESYGRLVKWTTPSGAPLDLTCMELVLRVYPRGGAPFQLTVASGNLIPNRPAGTCILQFTQEEIDTYTFGFATYVLDGTLPGGLPRTLLRGDVSIQETAA